MAVPVVGLPDATDGLAQGRIVVDSALSRIA
jgi:hypothetical protein